MNRRSGLLITVSLVIFCTSFPAVIAKMSNEDCLMCHGDEAIEAFTDRGAELDLHIPEDALFGSVHEGFDCTDCHIGADSFEELPHSSEPMKYACHNCHSDVYQDYTGKDIHGKAYQEGNDRAPYCSGCHGGHNILPLTARKSRMSKHNQPDTCGDCHGSEELNLEEGITKRLLVDRYKSSVHWQAIEMDKNGASCTDCHGYHTILSSDQPGSSVSRTGVAYVCKDCHPNESVTFISGAHGQALIHGNNDVPNCTTCHGDHDMASLRIRAGDAKNWAATQVCIWCHGNERMMARYGLDTTPVESYLQDFHGLTQRTTQGASATCADCHDPHHSLPSSHPSSRMHISNRGTACGKCHGKVSDSFAMSFSHKRAMMETGGKIERIVEILYIILIIASVIGMLVHNIIIWFHAVRQKLQKQKDKKQIRRMTAFEIVAHFVLFITFTALAVTGFALKFPEVFWARWLHGMGMTESVRAFIHRTSGVVMTLDIVIFLIYMAVRRRGKAILREMLPGKQDIREFIDAFKYYLGITEKKARFNLFSYAEKFEFWALIWGVAIMALTGFILWFPKSLPASWPNWIMNVSRVIHYYEALLATLAIIIWHGFHTFWHPHEYPMSTTWLTGYMTAEEAEHHFKDEAIKKMEEGCDRVEE